MNTTEELAHRKRRIERLLRGIGFSQTEAKRAVARLAARSKDSMHHAATPRGAEYAVSSLPCGMQAGGQP